MGPTMSPDGQWMWDGNQWIPAPPPSSQSVTQTVTNQPPQAMMVQPFRQEPKSKGVAFLFNFFLGGAGHLYLDDSRGAWMLIVGLICAITLILIPVTFIIWIMAMVQTSEVHQQYLIKHGYVQSTVMHNNV
jgi:TM2 domain-containing membrane protein YozV